MDSLIKFYFAMFDDLIKIENSNFITDSIENKINETREKLKDSFNEKSVHYTSYCHFLDKEFETYIDLKRERTNH